MQDTTRDVGSAFVVTKEHNLSMRAKPSRFKTICRPGLWLYRKPRS